MPLQLRACCAALSANCNSCDDVVSGPALAAGGSVTEGLTPVASAMRLTGLVRRATLMVALLTCIAVLSVNPAEAASSTVAAITVTPTAVSLNGNFSEAQLLVARPNSEGALDKRSEDLTTSSKYVSSDNKIVTVSESGRLLATGNGSATITVTNGESSQTVAVQVAGVEEQPKIGFDSHIRPILSRLGCNAGACHASQFGKGGFVLSVVGFDPDLDYNAMVRDRQQRRVSLVQPEESLLLRKPTLQVAHGGGKKLVVGSTPYNTMLAWLKAGASRSEARCSDSQKAVRRTKGTHCSSGTYSAVASLRRIQRRNHARRHRLGQI
jgi:hypothetical protein